MFVNQEPSNIQERTVEKPRALSALPQNDTRYPIIDVPLWPEISFGAQVDADINAHPFAADGVTYKMATTQPPDVQSFPGHRREGSPTVSSDTAYLFTARSITRHPPLTFHQPSASTCPVWGP
jgi:hypothetical protein